MNVGELINYEEWHFVDKSKWGQGDWESEPDKCQWIDKHTGYDCLIVRNSMGALCGYVGIKELHSLFGHDYDANLENVGDKVVVHGGLTFSGPCQDGDKEQGICHITESEDKVWWFGFDCAHCYDVSPEHEFLFNRIGRRRFLPIVSRYRDLDYVKSQIKSLASQLGALE